MPLRRTAWPPMLGLILTQAIGDAIRSLWEKNSQYIGILSDPKWFAADLIYAASILAFACYVYERVSSEDSRLSNLGVVISLKNFGSGFTVGLLLKGCLAFFLLAFCHIVLGVEVTIAKQENLLLALSAIFDAAYIGTFEEILFRGLLLAELCKVTRPARALTIQAGIFAIFHLHQAQLSVLFVMSIFIAGWVLGFVVIKLRSLWAAIGAHIAWNFSTFAIFGVSGFDSKVLLPPLVHLSGIDSAVIMFAQTVSASLEIVAFVLLGLMLLRRDNSMLLVNRN